MLLALIERDAIIVLISKSIKTIEKYIEISESEYFIDIQDNFISIKYTNNVVQHHMLRELKEKILD